MEWGADQILGLRKHAGMTQAQIAQWLGVTIKQVKYLEHRRRNPSGPTRRLLSILAAELKFNDAPPVQVLGASATKKSVTKYMSSGREASPANSSSSEDAQAAAITVVEAPVPIDKNSLPRSDAEQPSDGGAFVWQ